MSFYKFINLSALVAELSQKEFVLDKEITEKTKKTAGLYFKDVKDERPLFSSCPNSVIFSK